MQINLANTLLFRGMDPSDIEEMLGCLLAKECTYKKGEILFPEGSPTEQIGVVLIGWEMSGETTACSAALAQAGSLRKHMLVYRVSRSWSM